MRACDWRYVATIKVTADATCPDCGHLINRHGLVDRKCADCRLTHRCDL